MIMNFCDAGKWAPGRDRGSAFPGFSNTGICHFLHVQEFSAKIKKVPISKLEGRVPMVWKKSQQ